MNKIGGFALVYVAKDSEGNDYALKRLFGSDKEECNNIIKVFIGVSFNILHFLNAIFLFRRLTY